MFWEILGSIFLLKCGITFLPFLWTMCRLYLLPKLGVKVSLKKLGDWGVVTGATDGIGKAIAKQLAQRGLNVVLISRCEDKLQNVAEELESSTGVEVKTIQFDFNQPDDYEKIKEVLDKLKIAVLVNNVGIAVDHPDFFLYFSEEFYDSLVRINISSVLKMTRIVLGKMAERKKGIIVHVSSLSGVTLVPLNAVYGASKALVDSLGRSLNVEYKDRGVVNQVVVPYYVATKLSKMRPRGMLVPSADAYAKQCVDAFGLANKMAGFWSHEIVLYILQWAPSSIVSVHLLNTMKRVRMAWVRKQERLKHE